VNSFSAIFGETPQNCYTIDVRPKKRMGRYCNNNVVLRVLASGRSLQWRRRQQQTVFRGRNVYYRDTARGDARKSGERSETKVRRKKKPISRSAAAAAAATAASYYYFYINNDYRDGIIFIIILS